jgi:D-xylose transport system substrate-binding protein
MKKVIIALVVFAGLAIGGVFFLNYLLSEKQNIVIGEQPVVIGFSLGTTREERWFKDRDLFIKKAQELGAVVNVTLSDYDVTKQISQIENLISQGVSVIVIVPADSEKLVDVIAKAKKAGIKVIAYDRLINNSDIDLYISFDNVKVGELEAQSILSVVDKGDFAYIGGAPTDNNSSLLKEGSMNILGPKIKNGDIRLVVDTLTPDWKPTEAYKTIKDYLNSGKDLDAVVAANDGTASGVIQALKEKSRSGSVPVSGQDAELSALQRIVAGTQTSTVYKPIGSLASAAAEIAVAMAKGQTIEVNTSINNGKSIIPSYLLAPILVTKGNIMDTVIKDGFQTYKDVYQSTGGK